MQPVEPFLIKQKFLEPLDRQTEAQGLNRRRFLKQLGVSVGAGLMTSQSIAETLTGDSSKLDDNQMSKDDLPTFDVNDKALALNATNTQINCAIPSIATRLFASSNVGANDSRNQLSLQRMACAGFEVQNPEVTDRQYLRFAGTDSQRASDLQNIATGAIKAPKLLLGVRGGYGAMRLLPRVNWQSLGAIMAERGTILAGFSDVTAIQCALLAQGNMSSLAAPMLYSEFGKTSPDQVSCRKFVEALSNPNLNIEVQSADLTSHRLPTILTNNEARTVSQRVTGTIWGGNLSVVSALAGSPYLPNIKGGIVFLEDVGEQAYRIERMLYDLYLAGVFKSQQAIVFGALTGTGEDSYDARYDVSIVIRQLHELTGLPIYSGMSFGHIARKSSFPLGARCQISADTTDRYSLSFSDYPTIKAGTTNIAGLWQ